jgi:hypothetical protein
MFDRFKRAMQKRNTTNSDIELHYLGAAMPVDTLKFAYP